jgi:hypothetical protein
MEDHTVRSVQRQLQLQVQRVQQLRGDQLQLQVEGEQQQLAALHLLREGDCQLTLNKDGRCYSATCSSEGPPGQALAALVLLLAAQGALRQVSELEVSGIMQTKLSV